MRALITGGTKGIGRAVTMRLAHSGDEVVINYKSDVAAAEATAREVTASGGRARLVQADACSLDGISELAGEVRSTLGELDLLVHCAVAPYGGSALAAPEADFRGSVEKNGLSFLWLVRACKDLLTNGSSAIYLSSGGATRALPNYAPIGIAKALAEAVVRYLAAELAPHGVRVNAVSAAAVDTEALRAVMAGGVAEQLLAASARRNPSGRALEAADVAGAIMALASENASMIQGQIVRVDGGLGLL
jgi:enoyl-[acyl-carrier-protein] reductase (NADH)